MRKKRDIQDYDTSYHARFTQDIISYSVLLIGMVVICLTISLTVYYGWL